MGWYEDVEEMYPDRVYPYGGTPNNTIMIFDMVVADSGYYQCNWYSGDQEEEFNFDFWSDMLEIHVCRPPCPYPDQYECQACDLGQDRECVSKTLEAVLACRSG